MNRPLRVLLAALAALAIFNSAPAFAEAKLSLFTAMGAAVQTEPNQLRIGSRFTLGADSKGIDPLTQAVVIRIEKLLFTVPPDSFRKTELGWFTYSGTIGGNAAEAEIIPLGGNEYVLRAEIAGKKLKAPEAGPAKVQISIGNDVGVVMTRAYQVWY